MEQIFNEKYRPTEFAEVVGLNEEIPKLIESKNIPHMLFIGPAGTGKTTTAKIIIQKLEADCLLLNASKDRGIDTIRERIEPFARKASSKLKIVFLDEFDATTPAFQTALRNFMEVHSNNTRFIATCNYPNKIIDPLLSRFSQYKFSRYEEQDKIKHLQSIVDSEGLTVDSDVLTFIVKKYKDDIRGMINFLNQHKHSSMIKKEDVIQGNTVLKILSELSKKKWFDLRQELLTETLDYNYLIEEMENAVFTNTQIPVNVKKAVTKLSSKYQFEMNFSFNKELCFAALMVELEEVLQW